jgi:hypothetical protein
MTKLSVLLSVALVFPAGVQGGADSNTPEALILSLYSHHRPARGGGLDTCSRVDLARFCDARLTDLFLKDCACQKRTGEVCNLDWDPFYDAQDFGPGEPEPRIRRLGGASALEVTLANGGDTRLIYEMKKTKAGWRISNIKSPKWDLLKVLSGAQK